MRLSPTSKTGGLEKAVELPHERTKHTQTSLASLACVNPDCDLYGQKGGPNLIVRKVYSQDRIRYLRCRCCQQEFSERKYTALWNSKIPEEKAVSVAVTEL